MMAALVSADDLRSGAHWAAHCQDHRSKACVSPIHGKLVGHIWCLADAPVAGGKKVKQCIRDHTVLHCVCELTLRLLGVQLAALTAFLEQQLGLPPSWLAGSKCKVPSCTKSPKPG